MAHLRLKNIKNVKFLKFGVIWMFRHFIQIFKKVSKKKKNCMVNISGHLFLQSYIKKKKFFTKTIEKLTLLHCSWKLFVKNKPCVFIQNVWNRVLNWHCVINTANKYIVVHVISSKCKQFFLFEFYLLSSTGTSWNTNLNYH